MILRMFPAAAACAVLLAATGVCGAPATPTSAPSKAGAAAPPLTMAQVIEQLGKRGYKEFKEIERKGERTFAVKARDAQGAWVELVVDARTGEVAKSTLDR